jgi:hypothetical protein
VWEEGGGRRQGMGHTARHTSLLSGREDREISCTSLCRSAKEPLMANAALNRGFFKMLYEVRPRRYRSRTALQAGGWVGGGTHKRWWLEGRGEKVYGE